MHATPRPITPYYPKVSLILQKQISRLLSGNQDLVITVKSIEEQIKYYYQLISNSDFISAFSNTLIFTLGTVFFEGLLGLTIQPFKLNSSNIGLLRLYLIHCL